MLGKASSYNCSLARFNKNAFYQGFSYRDGDYKLAQVFFARVSVFSNTSV